MRWLVATVVIALSAFYLGIVHGDDKPAVAATWEHRVVGRDAKPSTITLYANGKINDPGGRDTWARQGNTLTLRWPNPKAPGGTWVDTCTVSPDGKTYTGRNQLGATVAGRLVIKADAAKPGAVAKVPDPSPGSPASTPPSSAPPAVSGPAFASAEDRRAGLELPPVGPVKAAPSDTVMADFKTARAAYHEALKQARLTIRTQYMEVRKDLTADAVKNAKTLQELNQQFMEFAAGPGKQQDTGPLPTHKAMAETVAKYWETVDAAAKKFGDVATEGLAAYEKAGEVDQAKLSPLRAAKLGGENAGWLGVWSSAASTGHDVWVVWVDEATGGWGVDGEINYRPGFTGNLHHGEKFKFANGKLSFQAVPVRDRKTVGQGVPVSLTLTKTGLLQFDGVDAVGRVVRKTLFRSGDDRARASIEYWGVPKAVSGGAAVAGKPDPSDPNYVWRHLASMASFPYLRDNRGPAWGEQYFMPWRSKHPTITPGGYGTAADMLLGRSSGGGKNQQYIELLFQEFDRMAATPFPYLQRATDDFHALYRARIQLGEADELFGNTPNSSIREFQQKVMLPAAKYEFQRELDRAELQDRLDRDFPGKYRVIDAPMSAASQAHLRDFIQGAKGLSDDVQQRAVVSGLLAYADMAQVDRQALLWRAWLLPLARACGGPPAAKPLVAIDGNWKANVLSADRGKNVKLADFLLRNAAGRDLTNVTVQLLIENEWGDRAEQYYFFDRLETAEVFRLTPHPRWDRRRIPFTNTVKARWSVWADQGTEEARAATLTNPTPIADAASARADFLRYDVQHQAEGEALGEAVRNLPLIPVVGQRQHIRLVAAAAAGGTYLVQPAEKARPLVVRFVSANAQTGAVELEVNYADSGLPYVSGVPVWKGRMAQDKEAGAVIRLDNGWSIQFAPNDHLIASIPKAENTPPRVAPLFRVRTVKQ